jgi:hypothetical protein
MSGRGRAPSSYSIWLLHEGDGHTQRQGRTGRCEKVRSAHTASGAVAQNQRGLCVLCRVQLHARGSVRSRYQDHDKSA